MSSIGNTGQVATTNYYQAPYSGLPANQSPVGNNAGMPYASDAYRTSNYSTGYANGVGAVGSTAMGVSGLANGVSSMSSSLGGIFGTVFDLIANILNTVVNLIAKAISGIMGLFGVGKKDKTEGVGAAGGADQMTPLSNNQGMGVMSPFGGAVPPPPPGTDVKQAYDIVNGDLNQVQDPNQGVQIINIHALKARDYRDKAEQFSKEAEKESREALYAAEKLQKNPSDSTALAKLQAHKSKAVELLKTAQEYTKAVYDESLYSQAALEILTNKFQGNMPAAAKTSVDNAWKNWIGGTMEKQFIFFDKPIKAAPESFMLSMNVVNGNIGRATQIIGAMQPAGAR